VPGTGTKLTRRDRVEPAGRSWAHRRARRQVDLAPRRAHRRAVGRRDARARPRTPVEIPEEPMERARRAGVDRSVGTVHPEPGTVHDDSSSATVDLDTSARTTSDVDCVQPSVRGRARASRRPTARHEHGAVRDRLVAGHGDVPHERPGGSTRSRRVTVSYPCLAPVRPPEQSLVLEQAPPASHFVPVPGTGYVLIRAQ